MTFSKFLDLIVAIGILVFIASVGYTVVSTGVYESSLSPEEYCEYQIQDDVHKNFIDDSCFELDEEKYCKFDIARKRVEHLRAICLKYAK